MNHVLDEAANGDATRRRTTPGMTRRDLLKVGAGLGGLAGLAPLLAACGSSTTTTASTQGGSSTPKRGGTFRFGLTGGTSSDTLDPLTIVNIVDYSRTPQLYDPLVTLDENAQPQLVLAEEITPNADASHWTIRLRQGVTFHNGKELTADDVVYLLLRSSDPKNPVAATTVLAPLDRAGIKKLDKYTVSVPCSSPFSTLVETLASWYSWVIPSDYNPKATPNGTGPFVYKQFTPGVSSTFVRNPNYWQEGLPYFDEVVIDDYQDETSQVSALQASDLDAIGFLSAASVNAVRSGGDQVSIRAGGEWNPFTMRVDVAPFNDVRVRQAFRLIVDRRQMLDLVFGGYGAVGNDLYGVWDPAYDHTLPQRDQDIEQAKFLLRKAGQENMSVQLVTSPVAQGLVRAAQVFAQQATAAGVSVNLRQVTPTEFFGQNYLKWQFAQDEWTYFPYFPQAAFSSLAGAVFNETHYADPAFAGLYRQALRTVDLQKRTAIAHSMQELFWQNSGYIVPMLAPVIDGYGSHLQGVQESRSGYPFNSFNFKKLWFA